MRSRLLRDCIVALEEKGCHDLAAELDEYRITFGDKTSAVPRGELRAVVRNVGDAVEDLERATKRALQDLGPREAESRLWDASRILHGGELSRQTVERLAEAEALSWERADPLRRSQYRQLARG